MKKFTLQTLCLINLLLVPTGCEKDNTSHDSMIFPLGRSFLGPSSVEVLIDGKKFDQDPVFDSCGGYWLEIPKSALSKGEDITVRFTRKRGDLQFFQESAEQGQKWTSPSYFIDCDNPTLVSKANELTAGLTTNTEKAKAIQQFVIAYVKLNIYKDSFLDKASKTYDLGYGTCMNFSRLYVALCRAVKIPARTIWGVIYGESNTYRDHHQWAEIQDDSDYWHPADFSYSTSFNLNDVRYLDLIYAAEENAVIEDRGDYDMKLGGLNYYHNFPVTLSGTLLFDIKSNDMPDSVIVEYSFSY